MSAWDKYFHRKKIRDIYRMDAVLWYELSQLVTVQELLEVPLPCRTRRIKKWLVSLESEVIEEIMNPDIVSINWSLSWLEFWEFFSCYYLADSIGSFRSLFCEEMMRSMSICLVFLLVEVFHIVIRWENWVYLSFSSGGSDRLTAFSILSLKNSPIVLIMRDSTSNSGSILPVRIA